ncbi:MAG TPA: alpha/beta hydrolase-fold protein [Ignavibacteriales bacterium]|nr:alpha/beta hydrolase-fold protein [Ignavibacteriales bacterium]
MFKLILFFMPMILFAQTNFDSFLANVNSLPLEKRQIMVDSFWNFAKTKGIPLTEGKQAVFFYRSQTNTTVQVAGDFNGWSPSSYFSKIDGTDLYYLRMNFTETARLDYKLIVNGNWILDPYNPNYCYGGYGPNSELAMPKYVRPWEINSYPSTQKGTIETLSINSQNTGKTYDLLIYLPYTYSLDSLKNFPTAYINDGSEYLYIGNSKNILDNLIDSNKIPPIIGIFVVPTNRNDEYAFSLKEKYAKFVAEELVPFIDNKYRTIKDRNKRAIIGTSLGGNISGYISYYYDNLFGLSGWHSPAFWVNNQEVANLYKNNPKKDIRIFSVWGTYEGSSISGVVPPLFETLKSKGYQCAFSIYDEGHSWGLWKATFDEILIYLFSDNVTSIQNVQKSIKKNFELDVFPNPANPNVKIKFFINENKRLTIKLYDLTGKIIRSFDEKLYLAGQNIEVINMENLPSGVYIMQLEGENEFSVKKVILMK